MVNILQPTLPNSNDITDYSRDISGTEIVRIEKFLTKEQCEYLVAAINDVLENHSDDDRLVGIRYSNDGNINTSSSPYIFINNLDDQVIQEMLKDINNRAIKIYEDLYGHDDDMTYLLMSTVNGMGVGSGLGIHADNTPGLAINIDTPHGFVLYLNDDYEGGELYYPNLYIALKPSAGDLLIHPGTPFYEHGVTPVISGMRYATTAFAKKKLP